MILSERAQNYLTTLERRAATTDRARLEDAFAAAGVPVLEPIVDFQITFGGYVQRYGFNEFVWGILHAKPDPDSFFEPNQLNVFSVSAELYFTCASCHGSDHWFLDARGALHWCFTPPIARSFATKIERDAVAWTLGHYTPRRVRPSTPLPEFLATVLPRLREGLVAEASDEYETLYMHDGLYAAVKGDQAKVYVYEEGGASLLAGTSATIER